MTETKAESQVTPQANGQTSNLPAEIRKPAAISERGIQFRDVAELWKFACYYWESGLVPEGFKNQQSLFIAAQMAMELGIPVAMGIQSIKVINNRASLYGDMVLSVVRRSGLMTYFHEKPCRWCDDCQAEADKNLKCPVCQQDLRPKEFRGFCCTSQRKGDPDKVTHGFNVRMATVAGLWGKKGPWTNYPDRMLRSRARTFNLRDQFPEILMGLRDTEEVADMVEATVVSDEPPTTRTNLRRPKPEPEQEPAKQPERPPVTDAEVTERQPGEDDGINEPPPEAFMQKQPEQPPASRRRAAQI